LPYPVEALELDAIQSAVIRVERDPYDRLVFWLKNEQVWKQMDDKHFRLPSGEPVVVIGHGALGSYHLSLQGESRWIRVRRIQ